MCGTCHQYYQRTGHVRPTTAPARRDGAKAGLKYNQVLILDTGWQNFWSIRKYPYILYALSI